jgi:hypothetical protein
MHMAFSEVLYNLEMYGIVSFLESPRWAEDPYAQFSRYRKTSGFEDEPGEFNVSWGAPIRGDYASFIVDEVERRRVEGEWIPDAIIDREIEKHEALVHDILGPPYYSHSEMYPTPLEVYGMRGLGL